MPLDEDSHPLQLPFGLKFMDHAGVPCEMVDLLQLLELIRSHEVIIVGEVETLPQEGIKVTDPLENLFPFWPLA